LGGGASSLGFAGVRFGLAAAQNFASDETRYRRPNAGLATQLDNRPVNVIEIARGIAVNHHGRLAGGGERAVQELVRAVPVVTFIFVVIFVVIFVFVFVPARVDLVFFASSGKFVGNWRAQR
jgi:hypothetical protein